ncbi:gamma-glutamyltransferase family protein [Roseovarius amoyensis]|uniref:gamma-glutamyltransferase family protein n=1 Tax=Roseovarius amoyensis TaxID=2211448 RepID=UPI000DBE91E1|nr:gamma-glutamyltransferase family protein [Roseovarius amoyensis]
MRDLHLPGRSPVLAENGLCATSHPLVAKLAVDMLERGGNAVDAAIAGAMVLNVCEPHMTGLGGDCFVLFTGPGGSDLRGLNGSGRAPAAASAADLRARGHETVPLRGAEAVTMPGAVDAFCRLSADHGRMGLDAVLAPAIRYAEAGVPVAPRVAFDWPTAGQALQGHGLTHFTRSGEPLKTGDIFCAPGQAEVLRRIAREGRDGFYTGEVADDMLAALRQAGGVHTAEDFAAVACDYTDPVAGEYAGVELVEHPPNGQGATAILLLNILSHFDIKAMDPLGAERIHIEAEATKLAYDARNRFIADPDRTARLEHMLAPETAARLAALIDPKRAMPAAASLTEAVHRDTVYITVVDRDRMAVSLIYSLYHGFGSGIASERFGILLQNRGAGFNLTPGHPNEMEGGKRPMHTIIPAMLRRGGKVFMPFGVMGGAYQPEGHARFVSNLRDFGMSPQAAIDAPRSFADAGVLKLERGYDPAVGRELAAMGHEITVPDAPLGGAQAIMIHDSGVLEGGSDSRKDGCALGY